MRSRLGHCCLQQTLSPTSPSSRPTGLQQLGLFVCMQDGEGLQHCLHKIQSLTISKTALAQHQQNSVQSSHAREHTHPTFPSSYARNFSATEGCHRLVTMATQSTLNQTKKIIITHSLCITFFFFPLLCGFLNDFPITWCKRSRNEHGLLRADRKHSN